MHQQNDPKWADDKMLPSQCTIGAKGCFISCLTYLRSRKENFNHEIPEQVRIMSGYMGFTLSGDCIWSVVEKYMNLRIANSRSLVDILKNRLPYVMRNVWVRGSNNQMFSHWVVELKIGSVQLMYDPLRTGGNFVHSIDFFQPVFNANKQINRRFVG